MLKSKTTAKHFLWFCILPIRQFARYFTAIYRSAGFRAAGVYVSVQAVVHCDPGCKLNISEGASVAGGSLLIAATDPISPGQAGIIRIGNRTAINEYCNIRASGSTIEIGIGCMLAQFVTIVGSNHGTALGGLMRDQPWDRSKSGVTIEDDVWVGANVVILPGVRISEGAVIAAGAVVNKDIPTNEIWGGVPARKLGVRHS